MKITQAVITAAGRNQRHLPLQTMVDREGLPRTVTDLFVEELRTAGIERIAFVVCPGDERLYLDGAVQSAPGLTFLPQTEPRGFGHAVLAARPFVGDEPFLLMVSDHLYVSDDPAGSCAGQLVAAASANACAVSAVQATHESELRHFGAVAGRLFGNRSGLYEVEHVLEKPTPTQAEEALLVPGLRRAYYLCFFGMHVLTPRIFDLLDEELTAAGPGGRINLSGALDRLAASERYLALELHGRRFDLERPYGLLLAQLALALEGRHRESVLSSLVELLRARVR